MSYWQSPEALPATLLLGACWDVGGPDGPKIDGMEVLRGMVDSKPFIPNPPIWIVDLLLLEVWHATSCLMNLLQYFNTRMTDH